MPDESSSEVDMSDFTLAHIIYHASFVHDEDRAPYRDVIRTCRSRIVGLAVRLGLCSYEVQSDAAGRALINWLVANKEFSYEQARDLPVDKVIQIARSEREMKDFFISYNGKDKTWAEWIAWILEDAGYPTVIQAWDFRPGGNFVLEMQKAATGTKRTIAVLSDNYLGAEYTQSEWANAFARDPQGNERTLLPVRITSCRPTGLLATTIYVDLVGLGEDEARSTLLAALDDRAKPVTAPSFPGTPTSTEPVTPASTRAKQSFPGKASSAVDVWQEKLDYLQQQEAIASDPAQKFALKKQIEEAKQKIQDLGPNPS